MMIRYTLAFALLAVCQAWILHSNFDEITVNTTENVQLTCKQEKGHEDTATLNEIILIRITKFDASGSKLILAGLKLPSKAIIKKSDDIQVTTNTDAKAGLSLKVNWAKATKDTAGAYGCDVLGYNAMGNADSVAIEPTLIKEAALTIKEVKELIDASESRNNKKRQELETEIANLRASESRCSEKQQALEMEIATIKNTLSTISVDANVLRREFRTKDEDLELKITQVKENVDLTFATKSELSSHVSELKIFTKNEITSDNNLDSLKHQELQDLIHQLNSSSTIQFFRVKNQLNNFRTTIKSRLDSQEKTKTDALQNINSTLDDVVSQINSLKVKCENSTRNLRRGLIKKINAQCSCPTTTETNDNEWPKGRYGLVKYGSVCPTMRAPTALIPGAGYTTYVKITLESRKDKPHLTYCMQRGTPSPSAPPTWPKGSYCIVKDAASCPQGFNEGVVKYAISNRDKQIQTIVTKYCCRSDGSSITPIKLPTIKAFYLYKYKGPCQKVVGMSVTDDTIRFEPTKKPYQVKKVEAIGNPDMSKEKIRLCLYQTLKTGPGPKIKNSREKTSKAHRSKERKSKERKSREKNRS